MAVPTMKRRLVALVVAVGLLVLSACGGKVDTLLQVTKDGSGIRLVTGTVSKDDMSKVKGGAKAVDAMIRKNLPPDMRYAGMSAGAQAGSTVYKFSVPFKDQADYKAKVINILGAGGVTKEVELTLAVHDSVFKNGIQVKENFSSLDLLQWLVQALVKGGTVPEDNKSSVLEAGADVVEFNGVKHSASGYGGINYDDVKEYGLRAVRVMTSGLETSTFTQRVTYDLPATTYATNKPGFDKFFKEAVPEGGTLSPPSNDSTVWTIDFKAASVEDLVAKTNKALNSTGTEFSVSRAPDPDNAMSMVTTVTGQGECSTICLEYVKPEFFVVIPEGWQGYGETTSDGKNAARIGQGGAKLTQSVKIQSADVTIDPRVGGGGRVAYAYSIRTAEFKALEKGINASLTPESSIGGFSTSQKGDLTIATVTIQGANAGELNKKLSQYSSRESDSSGITLIESDGGNLFTKRYALVAAVGLPTRLSGQIGTTTYTIVQPDGLTWDGNPAGATREGNNLVLKDRPGALTVQANLTASNPVGWLVVGGVVVGLLAIAGLVAWLVRRNNRAPSDTAHGQTQQYSQTQ